MKVKRFLTPRAINRFKVSTGFFLFTIAVSALTNYAAGYLRELEGVEEEQFRWNGHIYDKYVKRETPYGYVEEWTDNDVFCQR